MVIHAQAPNILGKLGLNAVSVLSNINVADSIKALKESAASGLYSRKYYCSF